MRAGPPLRSTSIFLLAGFLGHAGCFLDASPFGAEPTGTTGDGGGGGSATTTSTPTGSGGALTTSTTTTGSGGTTTTTDTTGGGGTTTTTDTTGGGGAGGTTTTTTTTTTPTTPTSCKDALDKGILTSSGTVFIDPDGDAGSATGAEVYCDQETDGGGWALVHSSNGSELGLTTAFWVIPYAVRFDTKVDPPGPPDPNVNYYAGWLYKHGKKYRDDVVDTMNVEVKGVLRAKAISINETTMKFVSPMTDTGNLSQEIYVNNFSLGWSSADFDGDPETGNCAVSYLSVTQHYGGCWAYNLGATNDAIPGDGVDLLDMGWGPHILNSTITQINMNLPDGVPKLTGTGGPPSHGSRLKRISRFTYW